MVPDPEQWNINKFETMLRYLVEEYPHKRGYPNKGRRSSAVSISRLHKMCYLSDFDYFELYGQSITGSIYVHGSNGPVPIFFDKAVRELVTDDIVEVFGNSLRSCARETYMEQMYNKICPSDDIIKGFLTGRELDVIDNVIERFAWMPIRELTALTKNDTAWLLAGDCQALNYGFAYYRLPELSVARGESNGGFKD